MKRSVLTVSAIVHALEWATLSFVAGCILPNVDATTSSDAGLSQKRAGTSEKAHERTDGNSGSDAGTASDDGEPQVIGRGAGGAHGGERADKPPGRAASEPTAGEGGPPKMAAAAGHSGDVAGTALTVEVAAATFARGTCGALEACMGKTMLTDSLQGMNCVDYRTKVYADRDYHWLPQSVALGRVTFRADALATCESDLVSRGCSVVSRRLNASCKNALEGKAGVGDDCAIDQECQGATFCDKGVQESCPGVCTLLRISGAACASSSQCADGLVCRSSICSSPLLEGDTCASHLKYGECSPGLVCQYASDKLSCQTIASVYAGTLGAAVTGTAGW